MKAGDKVIVIEADTHVQGTAQLVGQVLEVESARLDAVICINGNGDKVKLYYNEIRPFKEYQVLQILRQWKRSLK